MHLMSGTEKTPRRVRTSLEEKYAKLSKPATAVPSASTNGMEEQQDAVEEHSPVVTVVGAFLYSHIMSGQESLVSFSNI